MYSRIIHFGRKNFVDEKAKERRKEIKTEFWLFSKEELNQKEIFNLKRKILKCVYCSMKETHNSSCLV